MGSVSPAPSPTQHHPNTLAEGGVPMLPELWQLRAMPSALGSCSMPPTLWGRAFPSPPCPPSEQLHAIPMRHFLLLSTESRAQHCLQETAAAMGLHSAPSPHLWMHPLVLKLLAEMTAKPLSIIYARSRRTGEVLEDWRKAHITPVFKKDKEEDPGNYRPASLTSIPGDSDGTTYLGCHLQASRREKHYKE